MVEPRISVRYAVTPRVALKAAFGVYHQPPPAKISRPSSARRRSASPRRSTTSPARAFKLTRSLDVEVTGFLSESEDLVVRSAAPSPYLAKALEQEGIGRSYGTQFLLRQQQVGRFFGWVSYSILRSERKDHPDIDWRLFDYDQTHVFTALGSYDLGLGFEVGRALPLRDRLPAHARHRRVLRLAHRLVPAAVRARRTRSASRAFFALDVRLSKHFKLGKTEGEVYLDVQNVTNHSEPGGDRVQPELHAARLHHRAPDPAGHRREVVVVRRALAIRRRRRARV